MAAEISKEREAITFEQAEGSVPLPAQLKLREISPQLRSLMWAIVHTQFEKSVEYDSWRRPFVGGSWRKLMMLNHVLREHRMTDEFDASYDVQLKVLKCIFAQGNYTQFLGFVEWLLRQDKNALTVDHANEVFETCKAAYRVVGDVPTIVPIVGEEDRQTLERSFSDLAASEFAGAREHFRKAAEALTAGENANSIRESIHAVESVARIIAGKSSLADALAEIEKTHKLHGALKRGFSSLYGFTNDEQGIRHPLLEKGAPDVDETDALFMLGACAAFVSYLINRSRASHSK